MSAPRRKKESIWVTLAWTLNLAGLGGIALVAIAYVALQPVSAASRESQPISTAALPATYTPDPNSLYLPTVTPNPLSTLIVVQTPTPFVLAGGKYAHRSSDIQFQADRLKCTHLAMVKDNA